MRRILLPVILENPKIIRTSITITDDADIHTSAYDLSLHKYLNDKFVVLRKVRYLSLKLP